jgi:hypothetical protein
MPLQRPGRRLSQAWTLLGVTVVLVVLSLVIGLTGGETWSAVFGSIPVAVAFAVAANGRPQDLARLRVPWRKRNG